MDIISPVIDFVTAIGPTFKKYVKYQFCHRHYVHEFEKIQKNLDNRLKDIEARLETQCNQQPGKIAGNEVNAWREEARKETAVKVEDLICRGGCFTYLCSSRKLDKKTQELNEGIFMQGENYTNPTVSLVIDDHSIEYCRTVFEEEQEQLKLRQKDIEAKLKTLLMQPGKIASKEVEDWLKKAGEQIAIKVEDQIPQGECPSSSNLRKKTEELKQIFKQGEKYTNAGESLVVDDNSIEYYQSVFKENQQQLNHQKEYIEANLKTQCKQPGKTARKEVEDWLVKASQQIAIKVEDLIIQGESSSSTNLEEKTKELKHILEEGKEFSNANVSLVIDDHSIKGVPQLVEECSGRDGIREQILEWLKGAHVTRIAIWGMGGVGKTTIMKQVHNQLLKEPKFNKVIWVKVSKDFDIVVQQKKQFDILKFQKSIARRLELEIRPQDENEPKLTELISQKLGQGSYMLILDDVWQQFHLEDVGIPYLVGTNGCKLVLTTWSKDVAHAMDCEVIHVNPLPYDDALALFLKKVGSDMLLDGKIKRDIEPFLKKILQKCDGVPLAIVIVAKTMRGKLDPRSWKWALSKLSKFEGIVDCLKFSYECLEPQCRECFLYCALYPEDYEIPKEELIECWIEEGFIYEGETRDAMNCEGHVILEKLVDNCLLELVTSKHFKEDCVSMHDLLREMALDLRPQFLVKAGMGLEKLPEGHEWKEDLLKVSMMRNDIRETPSSMLSPKCTMLTTLLLSYTNISTIPEAFFEHMPGLKILDRSNNPGLSRLPSSVSKLEKLTTLLLRGCKSLREVPFLSNFGDLKKLNLSGTSIEKVPQGLNMLTNLKYLCLGRESSIKGFGFTVFDISNGFLGRLSEIPDGLLQTLSKLQHLEVDYNIPLKWGEIGRLGKLEYVKGRFSTLHEMGIFFNYGEKFLNMYDVFVGSYSEKYPKILIDKKLKTIECRDINIYGEPKWLLSDVQQLFIYNCKDVRSLNDISGFQDATDLRFVYIECCDGMECIFPGPWLNSLQNLEEVGAVAKSVPLPADTFSSLEVITIQQCHKMKKLFSIRWLGCLQSLKTITVTNCQQMEEIIWSEYEGEEKALEKVALPKLEILNFDSLPQLKGISSSRTILICDSIKKIEIFFCENIESLFWSGFNPLPTLEHLDLTYVNNLKSVFDEEALGLSPPLATTPTISFSLKGIRIQSCAQLKNVFSSGWLLSYFQSLETIWVWHCTQMVELISSSAYEEEKVTLRNLKSLELKELYAMKSICSTSSVLICNSIEKLLILYSEKLKRIPLNSNNAQLSHPPSLKEIWVDSKERWESLEWDNPNAKDILLPFCKFLPRD